MSTREKEADLTEAEGSVPGHLELEDEKRGPHSDDDTHKPEDKPLLSHEESFLHQEDVLQETRVNNPEDKDLQNVPIKKEDEGSDSDSGNISTGLSIYMALLASQNSQASQTFGTSVKVTEDSWKTYSDNQCDVSGLTNINQSPPFQTVDDNLMTHTDNMTKESKNISGAELYTDFSPFVEEQLKVEPLSKLKLSATTDMMGGQARLMKTVEGIHHFKQTAESPCQKYFQQQPLFIPSLGSLLLPTTGPAQPYFPHYPFTFSSSIFNPQEFPPREPITDSSIISDPPGAIVEVPWISGQNEVFSSSGSSNWEPSNWNPDMSIYRLQEDEESQECQNSKRSKYEQELDVSSKENLRT